MMNMKKLLATFIFISYASTSLAQSAEPEYFLDHYFIHPGETKTVAYSIPTSQHFLQCNQDGDGANLGSIEWKYKGTSFKAQIGNYHYLTLTREDIPRPNVGDLGQTADASGNLVITDLDPNYDLYVTCRYSLTPNW